LSGKWSNPRRCNCKDPVTGKELGRKCPDLGKRHHGTYGYATRIPATIPATGKPGVRDLHRFNADWDTKAKADKAAEQVWDLIKLAGDDKAAAVRIGDMIFEKTARGGELPAVEDVRRRLGLRRANLGASETFGDAWAAWLTGKRKAKPSYLKWLGEIGRNWLLPVLKDIPVDRINGESCGLVFSRVDDTNEELDLALEAAREPNVPEDVRKERKHVGVSTQHGIYRALRAFLNYELKRAHAISFNPIYAVELEPAVHAVPLTWSPEQVGHFLSFHAEDRLYWLWRLALLRGFRRGELCGMGDADFDDGEGCITVNVALLEIGGHLVWGKPKSRAGERVVDLDDDSVKAGKAHRARRKRERLRAGGAWKDSGCMFTTELGDPLRPDWVSARFKELAAEAALPVIKFHAARHTAASLALEAGVDIKVVSAQLGHSGTQITRDTYQHVRRAVHRDAAEKVVALLPDKDAAGRKAGS
jgi:integrase